MGCAEFREANRQRKIKEEEEEEHGGGKGRKGHKKEGTGNIMGEIREKTVRRKERDIGVLLTEPREMNK